MLAKMFVKGKFRRGEVGESEFTMWIYGEIPGGFVMRGEISFSQ